MLIDTIKARIRKAMLDRNVPERDTLRLALGELQTAEARGESMEDAAVEKILRKLVKSINETLDALGNDPAQAKQRAQLEQERTILETLLPKRLTTPEIEIALNDVAEAIRGAGAEGQAIGIAMKHLKRNRAEVDGKDVATVVAALRA